MVTIRDGVASVPGLAAVVTIPEFFYYGSKTLATFRKINLAEKKVATLEKQGDAIKTFEAQVVLTGYKKELSERLWNLAKVILAIIPGLRYYLAKKEEKMAKLLVEAAAANDNQVKTNKYKEAAALGSSEANFQLYFLTSYPSNFEYLEKAATQGHAKAQYNLGMFYANASSNKFDKSVICPHILKWLKLAALQNNPSALNSLGLNYFEGNFGLNKSLELGIDLLKKAFDKDNKNLMIKTNYAFSLLTRGKNEDFNEGYRLFVEAANEKCGWANCLLGICFYNGTLGFTKDRAKSKIYYQVAAENGVKEAREGLAKGFPAAPAPAPIPEKSGVMSWLYSLKG